MGSLTDPLQRTNDLIVIEHGSQTVDRCLPVLWTRPDFAAEDAARFLNSRNESSLIVHCRELRCTKHSCLSA